jgi:2-keto-4-pentenoate hydratase/2-oxohepta-3-ene-1,7-dioic acid hydratase in catechol pathway
MRSLWVIACPIGLVAGFRHCSSARPPSLGQPHGNRRSISRLAAFRTFCPMGPWLVTTDEIANPNLDLKCWVNGELRQSANTRDLIFDVPTLFSHSKLGAKNK